MDETTAAELETKLRNVMAAIAADLGVRVEPAKVTWTRDGRFTATVSGEVIGAAPEERVATREAEEWGRWVRRKAQRARGFLPGHLGSVVEIRLVRYRVVGITRRSAARPVVVAAEPRLTERRLLTVNEAAAALGLPGPRLPDPRAMCTCGYSAKFHRGLTGPVTTDGSEAPIAEGGRVLLPEGRRGGLGEERGTLMTRSRSGGTCTVEIDAAYRRGREDDGLREVEVSSFTKLLCERFRPSGKVGGEG